MSHIPSAAVAPPEAATPEFFLVQYANAMGMQDTDIRALGEGNAPPAVRDKYHIDWKPSRYADSRKGHPKPINVSGLRQMNQHWAPMLEFISALRREYVNRFDNTKRLTVSDLWRLTRIALSLPNYVIRRPVDPVSPDEIPAVVSAIFKTLAGLFIVATDMFVRNLPMDAEISVDGIIEHTDKFGLYEGGFGVCAGTPGMIRDVVELVVEGGDIKGDSFRAYIPDAEQCFRYGVLFTRMEFVKQALRYELELCGRRVRAWLEEQDLSPEIIETKRVFDDSDAKSVSMRGILVDQEAALANLYVQLTDVCWWDRTPFQPLRSAETLPLAREIEGIAGGPAGAALRHCLIAALAEMLNTQHRALLEISRTQMGIDDVMQRGGVSRSINSADINRTIGLTPIWPVSHLLELTLWQDSATATLRRGRKSVEMKNWGTC